jgi:glycosyltransferase involved in cell wall biosynthesis
LKVALITPWPNVWVPFIGNEVIRRGHTFQIFHPNKVPRDADVLIHGWSMGQPVEGPRNVVFMRAFEIYEEKILKGFRWDKAQHIICVSPFLSRVLIQWLEEQGIKIPVTVIPNAVDLSAWTFKQRTFNGKLGMACHVHWKKNIPLALQICAALPEGTSLHIAGEIQDRATMVYLNEAATAMRRKVIVCGQLDHHRMDSWWEQFGVCLSTSVREGCPNNVLEVMAKGIKPIIHCWPGAEEQFPGLVFKTVDDAVKMIMEPSDSQKYRDMVTERHSLENIKKVVDIALEVA